MKKLSLILFFLVLLIPFIGYSQESSFENKFVEARSKLIALDSDEAFRIADSLLKSSDTEIHKIRAYNLLSFLHKSVGTYSLAINYAKHSEKLSELSGIPDFKVRTAILLASIYREIGVYEESHKYLRSAKVNLKGVNDKLSLNQLSNEIMQEDAYNFIIEKRYSEAIELMDEAVLQKGYIDNENPFSLLLRSKSLMIMAESYKLNGDQNKSIALLKQVLDEIYGVENLIRPFTFQLLSEAYINLNELDSARNYLDLVGPYMIGSNNVELKKRYYYSEAQLNKFKEDYQQSLNYINKYYELDEQRRNAAEILGNQIVKNSYSEIKLLKRNNTIMILVLIFIVCFMFLYYFLRIRHKSKLISQNDIISNDLEPTVEPFLISKPIPKDILNLDSQISLETETRLVKRLNELEDEKFYLSKNITLNSLTNKLNTNQKYVSYIVRKYKNQHFNDYIQNLRIQYIVTQLENNKIMLDYKLSYLADLAGFSSHSKFTIAFKAVMDITPSHFIERLKNTI